MKLLTSIDKLRRSIGQIINLIRKIVHIINLVKIKLIEQLIRCYCISGIHLEILDIRLDRNSVGNLVTDL